MSGYPETEKLIVETIDGRVMATLAIDAGPGARVEYSAQIKENMTAADIRTRVIRALLVRLQGMLPDEAQANQG